MRAKLKKVHVWTEKDSYKDKDAELEAMGYLRVYVGQLFVGHAVPVKQNSDLYTFDSARGLYHIVNMTTELSIKGKQLQVILDDFELAFRELLKKIAE